LYENEKLPAYALAETSAVLGNKSEALQYLMTSRDRHEMVDCRSWLETLCCVVCRMIPNIKKLVVEIGFAPVK
jgi:hypothetical protein